MTRRRVNNPLALAVLGCLGERPMHPYEISSTLRHRGKEKSIRLNYGSLYAVVAALEKHGLIAEREKIREGNRPERTVYEITPAGMDEFEDWLSELLSTPSADPSSLESALSLIAGLAPDEAARLLEERVGKLEIELRSIAAANAWARENGIPEVFLVEGTFREAMLRAERGYAAGLAADIRSGALGGTATWRRLHELRASGTPMEEILTDPVGYLGEEGRILASDALPNGPDPGA
ncbi:PadR family transcriptional regulator [Intrasporangium oryzae NRRL B-24470]|uniref:PadR family transcriptional regulator n=1 Tax=Intrasporangium oryzae NRRL B-24470 TaxID=1386089 RepID=W9G7B6_9MICO|nr:PadR family transcriptional regulator [Intrasporangium oryzae]EWT01177.1 PadR family transcriptional regulator [Intrasporangium oryzae NRRL B-24470]